MNLLEEARSIRSSFPTGTSISAIARAMKKSTPWVKYRLDILKMPAELQESIAAGLLTLNDVRVLVTLPPEKLLSAAETMMRHGRGTFTKPRRDRFKKKRRSQINRLIERLFDAHLDGLPTLLLAWTQGGVPDEEVESEILRTISGQSGKSGIPAIDVNDNRTNSNPSGLPKGNKPGDLESGNGPDCPDDAGDLQPAGD